MVSISSRNKPGDLDDIAMTDGYCSMPMDGVSKEAAHLLGFEIAYSS